jgi:PhoPQ-activated pathogenicity-related protein
MPKRMAFLPALWLAAASDAALAEGKGRRYARGKTGRNGMLGWVRAIALALVVMAAAPAVAQETALDRYVHKADPAYGWKLVSTIPGDRVTTYVLELTSQSWRSAKDVDRPVWKHWLTIVKPDKPKSTTGLITIWQGSNDDPAPTKPSDRALRIATETNTVVAEVGMVPNQPLRFTDSPDKPRVEDDIIAYTRVKHFATKDDEWLVRLAMVKSGVKAMDAVQEFLKSPAGGGTRIDKFVVTGASKRGWTTWLIGAVDPRVVAIIPLVIDALNSEEITKHHFEAYGFFSPALDDYVEHGLFPGKIGTPEYRRVLAIEDPYNYLGRAALKMPKFMIDASGDQFFLPDGSQFYWAKIQPEKHIRYVPNTRHNLAGSDSVDSLIAFYDAVVTGRPRPRFDWTKAKDGTLVVKPVDKPREVRLWQATNPKTRDFRMDTIGAAYTSTVLQPRPDGAYVGKAAAPASGWTAYFVELTYDSGTKTPFKFTTEVAVTPDVLPHKWSEAAAKYPPK